ncbi:MAG: sugar MFS transporter [Bacteroidales bacterium]|jgi:FHS family L-fucose permease-like MFS transporter|nr:sugar MFS transporter [Bacteroidales bacterium]
MNTENAKQPNYTFALVVVFVVCFLTGFIITLNNSMIAFCKQAFDLSEQDGQYVNTAFFGAYLLSIPFALLMSKIGYKRTLILGLAVAGVGFIINAIGIEAAIEAQANVYVVFLLCMCIVAMGVVMLQNVVNPYVMALGDKRHGAFRMTLSQALYSVATTLAPIFITYAIIGDKTPAPEHVPAPFIGLGIFTLLVCITLTFLKLPQINEAQQSATEAMQHTYKKSIFNYPHVWFSALGLFMYLGLEVGVPSMLPARFRILFPDMADSEITRLVTSYLAFYWGAMMIGRFIGAGILTRMNPRAVLGVCLGAGALCIAISLTMSNMMIGIWFMLAAGLFHSVMWPLIFNLGLKDLGPHTKTASGVINTGVIGGAILMPIMGSMVDAAGVVTAMSVMFVFYAYILWFCIKGSKIGVE